MTRVWVWIGALAVGAASAGPAPEAEVEALVRRNLAGISKHCTQPADCAVDATTIAYASNGVAWGWKPDDGVTWSDILFTGFDGEIRLAPRAGLVVVDADVAWFQMPYTATLRPEPEPDRVSHMPSRVGGIAVKQRDGWHLAGIAYTDLISDRELFTQPPHPDWFDPKGFSKLDVKGDDHLARDVAGWFASGFAAHAGPTARLVASGSSEAELARGADALKLATGWDKLGIRPWQIDAERVAGGKLAFVSATVLLPVDKKTGHAAPLVLFAVLAPDGAAWRWVSLQYGATDR
jgi:hypothetical protein